MTVYDPRNFRILCVEDEPEILRDIAEELTDHGFAVEKAASAEAALPLIDSAQPDLILCDMQMPGMNGVELLETLRVRQDQAGATPFIFLTAFGDRENMLGGRRAGADDYLVKPIDYDLLIAAVESHLQNLQRRRERIPGSARVSEGDRFPARDALISDLAERPSGTMVALVSYDNIGELMRRFQGYETRRVLALSSRIQAMTRIRKYRLNGHLFALVGEDEDLIGEVLPRISRSRLRDRDSAGHPLVAVNSSIVMGRTTHSEAVSALIERMADGVRLVQREGGQRIVDVDDPEISALRLAGAIRSELVNAIRQGQMHVCIQPKVRALDGRAVAGEVLVRWVSPLLGQLSPATFIPIVERAGLLPHVTDWVLRQTALCQLALARDGLTARLAVNIGASEFTQDLPARIAAICAETGADPALIEVEITETTLMTDLSGANAVAHALHDNGMVVALDDFGTGFSSLNYLRQCDVDAIKIDRSFVERVADDESDQKIISGSSSSPRISGSKRSPKARRRMRSVAG